MVKITVKKNQNVKLKMPKFICDYLLKENVPKPFDNLVQGFKFITIVGNSGAGKTSLLFSLFKDKRILKKAYNNIILCMPSHSTNSMEKSSNIFKDIAEDKQYDSIKDIDEIREKIMMYAEEGESTALIIDDQTSLLKDAFIQKTLSDLIFNRRHYKLSIYLLVQVFERIPLPIRKTINTLIILFKPAIKDFLKITEESLEMDEDLAHAIKKIAFKKKHDRLMVDIAAQKIYANCNELIISDN